MKKLLHLLLCFPMLTLAEQTYVPDDNFEAYLETHNSNGSIVSIGSPNSMGNGIPNDDYVTTANINNITGLNVEYQNISDLTGIEDFTALTYLNVFVNQLTTLDVSNNTALERFVCGGNQLTTLDVSQNTALENLSCGNNQLTSLDVSQNTALIELSCDDNQLTTLDVSNNTALEGLWCLVNQLTSLDVSQNTVLYVLMCGDNPLTILDVSNNTALSTLYCYSNQLTTLDVSNNNTALATLECQSNQLTTLDVSQNTALTILRCDENYLTTLDVRNGNNTNMFISYLNFTNNPQLYCIDVDDFQYSLFNWTNIDPQHYFSNNCSGTAIEEHSTNKELLRTIDVLGRATKNQPLFYIYDDGTVEKKIVVE